MNQVVKEAFNDKFPGENLVACLSMFSLPTSIGKVFIKNFFFCKNTYYHLYSKLKLILRRIYFFFLLI